MFRTVEFEHVSSTKQSHSANFTIFHFLTIRPNRHLNMVLFLFNWSPKLFNNPEITKTQRFWTALVLSYSKPVSNDVSLLGNICFSSPKVTVYQNPHFYRGGGLRLKPFSHIYIYELHVNLNRISVGSYITVRTSVSFGPCGRRLDTGCLLGLF